MRKNSAILRLLRHAGDPKECWVVPGYTNKSYMQVRVSGKSTSAHRVMYELVRGPIPSGLHLDHLCRNRPCFNPNHLEPVTIRENLMRGDTLAAKFSRQTHCKNGHPFDAANTILRHGHRACRECGRQRAKAYARRQAEMFGAFRSTLNRRKKNPDATQRTAKKRRKYIGPEQV